jgi:4-aminobutyrate aminotransferase
MGPHLAQPWYEITDLEVVTGRGCVVVAADGAEYLDFTSGIAVTSTGHCHPKVVAAIAEQAGRFIHAQVMVYRHPLLEPLAARLAEVTPAGIDSFFFTNSGAEATEGAVKLARQATGRPNLIVFEGSFHGRTAQTMAMTTSKSGIRAGYQPLPAGVYVAPFPDPWARRSSAAEESVRCLEQLERLLATQTAPGDTAAVVIEPELGEGGYLPAPVPFLGGVAEICRRLGILFVADEVQTGFGRTGRMFAVERYDVLPDILIMAKGIASGFPFAAIGASAELTARWPRGSHGGTYGGNPIGCAAALATLEIITAPGFLDEVRQRGDQLRYGLETLAGQHACIGDVRGLGLMIGTQIVDPATGRPDAGRAAAVQRHCREAGRLLLAGAGTDGSVVRWMPPLVVSAAEIDQALAAFAAAVKSLQ